MADTQLEADRLKLFIANVTDYAIYMLSPDGIVVSWNAGAERFKGYKADEIIGENFSNFYTLEDRAAGAPARALQQARTMGRFEAEGWRVRKDKSLFWASVVLDPIFNDDGDLLGFTKITRDITEKRLTTERLHQSEEKFRLLVQSVTDYAIYMLTPAGLISNWNAGAERIKRLRLSDVEGTHFSRFYTEEDRLAKAPERALQAVREHGRFETEGWRVRGDGERFWAHVLIDPVHDSHGALIGFAKITRDITERRDAAVELERTREALFQSQKLEAIGKLTGGIAHDFNNHLSVICSGLDLLRAGEISIAQRKIIESMERSAQRGSALTNQLLAFARQQPLHLECVNPNVTISSFEAVLQRALPSASRLLIQQNEVRQIRTDVSQFESALLNLVINARDALEDHGQVSIKTGLVQLADNEIDPLPTGNYVVVSVADDGCGMSPEVVSQALEPFFTTKPLGKGTGLGLSQVYGLVQQSGGQITIDSVLGKGTTITMYFPADQLPEQEQDDARPKRRILIVDDQPDVLDMAVAIFQSLGFDTIAANNGAEALSILERHTDIRMLFTDVVMPNLDGVALAQAAQKRIPGLKVLLTSGYMSNTLREQFGDALSAFDLIGKPYRVQDLKKILEREAILA
jgi:PAS domain S-box-containing protein